MPWKPKSVAPPVASEPLYARLTALTAAPVWVSFAFHAEVTFWSPPKVHRRSQPEIAGPRLVTLTEAVNPPLHWLTV